MRYSVIVLSALGVFAASGAASAQEVDALRACREIENVAQRVACYDALLDTKSAAPGEASVAGSRAASAPVTEGEAGASFPERAARVAARKQQKDQAAKERATRYEGADVFSAQLRSIQRLSNGSLVAELSNGEIWVQTSGGRPPFVETQSKSVVIRRNVIGSFTMKIDNAPYAFGVRQVR